MVESCSTHSNDDKLMQYFGHKTSRKNYLSNIVSGGRIITECVLEK
jgi:hypothetical protein